MAHTTPARLQFARCGHLVPFRRGAIRVNCDWCTEIDRAELYDKMCALCGDPFTAVRIGPTVCSPCRKPQPAAWTERVCPSCGQTFLGRRVKHVYCSKPCRKPQPVVPISRPCLFCGQEFLSGKADHVYCSKRCTDANQPPCSEDGCDKPRRAKGLCSTHYNRKYHPGRHEHQATCELCGRDYQAKRSGQRFCSILCRDGGSHRNTSEIERQCWRDQRRRRRGARRTGEAFDDQEIFDRDQWRCGICRRKVNPELRWPHPLSASLDHIIPISKDPDGHRRANVRLAHLRCNIKRGNRVGDEQLMLIG